MRSRHHTLLRLGLGLVLVLSSQAVGARTLQAIKERARPNLDQTTAIAALTPVGAVSGWGRAVVRDNDPPSGSIRSVQVAIHGMAAHTEYIITIEGVDVGTVRTNQSGSAELRLQDQGEGHNPVPDDLPEADQLESVTIFDGSFAATLTGTFTAIVHCPGDLVYEELIELDDMTQGGFSGLARVEMRDSGYQEFMTRATGLVPGNVYKITVDDLETAIQTADSEGQAGVLLNHPSEENPLPTDLNPVSEIVTVMWSDQSGETILLGSFPGDGARDCRELEGEVIEITSDGFILQFGESSVMVSVTPETRWINFINHGLQVGDQVRVNGCFEDEIFVAERVKLIEGQSECDTIEGVVEGVEPARFEIRIGEEVVTVVTTSNTEMIGFGDGNLEAGDTVKVGGCWDDEVFIADWVKLLDDGEECDSRTGYVTEITTSGFKMQVANTSQANLHTHTTPHNYLTVIVTPETQWEGFDDHQLTVGDKVRVEGCWDGDSLVAEEVELLEAEEECGWRTGYVTELTSNGFKIEVVDGSDASSSTKTTPHNYTRVIVTNETEWIDFGDHVLTVGDKVKVEGCWDGEFLVAELVRLLEAEEECGWRIGYVTELTNNGFKIEVIDGSDASSSTKTTPNNYTRVIVTNETEWIDFGDHVLTVGDKVKVEGCWDGDFLVAELVKLLEAEEECGWRIGYVTELTNSGFKIEVVDGSDATSSTKTTPHNYIRVIVTNETEWIDFGDHVLTVGDKVKVEGCWDGNLLVASAVRLLEAEEECCELQGTVTEITANGFIIETDNGLSVHISTQNRIESECNTVQVIVTPLTQWIDFGDHQLAVGDTVKLEGCYDGDFLIAVWIKLIAIAPECATLEGEVTAIGVDEFVLSTEQGDVIVEFNDETQWINFGNHALAIGDTVKVEGCWRGEVLVAERIKLLDTPQQCAEFEGEVLSVGMDEFLLKVGGNVIIVEFNSETQWLNFGDHQLTVGDLVRVEGCWEGQLLVAVWVKLLEAQQGCMTLEGPVAMLTGYGFALHIGADIVPVETDSQTLWLNFGDHILATGDVVRVDGCWENGVFMAVTVTLLEAAP
ncbi:MAG: hypothetical protein GY906_26755 [bacterium]|nr:hypothetical protein [bacterium]